MAGFADEPSALRDAELAAAAAVIDSHHWVLGSQVTRFEAAWAQVSGSEHAVGVANGLDAIEIALRCLGVGPGDEVVTTSMTAFATVLAIVRAGATPVLADIDPGTGLLSMASVERCLSPRTRAVVLVHLYGQARDVASWVAFCAAHDIVLVEDCAQSHLAVSGGRPAGTFGPMAAYSFYPTKNLGAIGDAGAVVTDDAAFAEQAACLRNYGQRARYEHVALGLNSRLDELQAALLLARLDWLVEFTARRQEVAATYREAIVNPAVRLLDAPIEHASHVYHQFVVTTDDREALAAHLASAGVGSLVHYPVAMQDQPALAGIGVDPAGLPASAEHARICLSIPCHPQLTDTQVEQVVAAVNAYRPSR